ncbi:hypothetical protein F5I97DRAFT_1783929, partial [Phlebopus sp. FC_14]
LHPVSYISLLKSYKDPSKFHVHSNLKPFELVNDSTLSIHSILDSQHIGHYFKYFVHFHSLLDSENSWIPLSDIPRTYDKLIDCYHKHHPHA